MNTTIHLQYGDLLIAALLVLGSAVASWALRLRLQGQLLIAAARMVLQLMLVGWVLRWVFAAATPWVTALVAACMIGAAAREVAARPSQQLRGSGNYSIAALVVSMASVATVVLALLTALRPEPWYDARYAIALMGIVLGSVLNAAASGSTASSRTCTRAAPRSRPSWPWASPCARRWRGTPRRRYAVA